jgi:hypothetical protein
MRTSVENLCGRKTKITKPSLNPLINKKKVYTKLITNVKSEIILHITPNTKARVKQPLLIARLLFT